MMFNSLVSFDFFYVKWYTPMAVVIDNDLPREPLISLYVPDWPLPPGVYIQSECEMALQHV